MVYVPYVETLEDGEEIDHDSENDSLGDKRMVEQAQDGEVRGSQPHTEQGNSNTEQAFTSRLSRETSNRDNNRSYPRKA